MTVLMPMALRALTVGVEGKVRTVGCYQSIGRCPTQPRGRKLSTCIWKGYCVFRLKGKLAKDEGTFALQVETTSEAQRLE